MRRVVPVVALLLAYAMTPGALELTENAIHLVAHGDTAHAGADHGEDSDTDEHGCSGTYHACTCHSSPQFADNAVAIRAVARAAVTRVHARRAAAMLDSGFVRGIDRPPRPPRS